MLITSLQNPKIRLVRGLLARRKEREENAAFVVEGVRLLEEALYAGWQPQFLLFTTETSERGRQVVEAFAGRGATVDEVPAQLMAGLSDTEANQGVLAVFGLPEPDIPANLNFLLVADRLRDPGNLGTLLRTAAAAGVQAVVLTPGTTDPFAPKVVRSGMGAQFHLPVFTVEWEEIRSLAKEISHPPLSLYMADAKGGQPAWDLDLTAPVGLVVGGEAEGASRTAHKYIDGIVSIPMPGAAESLNAAVAASILLFEVVRQRSQ